MFSLKQQLLNHIGTDWIKSSTLEDYARTLGYKSSTAGRKMRECAHEGLLDRKIENGIVHYRLATKQSFYEIKPVDITKVDFNKLEQLL